MATSAGSRPALSSSSIWSRCSRAMLPWWARTSSSPASSFSRCASRSRSRRLLVKTIVLRWLRISSRIRGWIAGQMLVRRSPPVGRAAGLLVERQDLAERRHVVDRDDDLEVERLARAGVDDRRPRGPARRRRGTGRSSRAAAGWRDRPIRCGGAAPRGRRRRRSRRSRVSARCAPRFVPAIAWTSSTITCSTPRRTSRACAREHQVERLGRRDQDVRRVAGDLAAVLGGRVAGPAGDRDLAARARRAAAAARAIPASGARRFRSTS